MHEILVNRLGGLSLLRKSVVRLSDRPDMTVDVYRGRKTTIQHDQAVLGSRPPGRRNLLVISRIPLHIPYFFGYKMEFFLSKTIPKI